MYPRYIPHPTTHVARGDRRTRTRTARPLCAAVFCLVLCVTAQAQTQAAEVLTQVYPAADTIKCDGKEYRLTVVNATLPSDRNVVPSPIVWADAMGFALVPPQGSGPIKLFARYWFNSAASGSVPGKFFDMRDDDTGAFNGSLKSLNKDEIPNRVNAFFQNCELKDGGTPEFKVLIPKFGKVLDEASPSQKLESFAADLGNNDVQVKFDALKSDTQNLGTELTLDDIGQGKFARAVRASLDKLFSVNSAPPTQPTPTDPAAFAKLTEELAKATTARDAALKAQQQAEAIRDEALAASRLSSFLNTLIWVAAIVGLLILVGGVLLYRRRSWREKLLFPLAEVRKARKEAVEKLYLDLRQLNDPTEAQARLNKLLDQYPVSYEEVKGQSRSAEQLYANLRGDLMSFHNVLDGLKSRGTGEDKKGLAAAKQFLIEDNNLGDFYKKSPGLEEGFTELKRQLNESLTVLVGNEDPKILPRVQETKQQTEKMWLKYWGTPCREGALTKIADRWEKLVDSLEPLKKSHPPQKDIDDLPLYVLEAANLFDELNTRFPGHSRAGDLRTSVIKFLNDFDDVYSEVLPEKKGNYEPPGSKLVELDALLKTGRNDALRLKNLQPKLVDLKNELKLPDEDMNDMAIMQRAMLVASAHEHALALLGDYDHDQKRDLVAVTTSVADKIGFASKAISGVVDQASGTIDDMVASLIAKYRSNEDLATRTNEIKQNAERLEGELIEARARADNSTRLAVALSQYVNLCTDGDALDGNQVRAIYEQFIGGEETHRELRLRLSATLLSLKRAVEKVGGAGRTDVLTALRINRFEPELWNLLKDMENFKGDSLWRLRLLKGFESQWLHDLLRADLLATTYFGDDEVLSSLIDPLRQAGEALRATMRTFGVKFPPVRLLSAPPRGTEPETSVDPSLFRLQVVKQEVRRILSEHRGLVFLVDIESFPFEAREIEPFNGRFIKVNPSEWLPNN